MRTTFLVGRLTPKSAQIVVVNEARPSPIRGPWTLRAMTRGTMYTRDGRLIASVAQEGLIRKHP